MNPVTPPGGGAPPGGGQRPRRQLSPQQAHGEIDAYEQWLKDEQKKVKAVRTLFPKPPEDPSQGQ